MGIAVAPTTNPYFGAKKPAKCEFKVSECDLIVNERRTSGPAIPFADAPSRFHYLAFGVLCFW